jgi:hypothetical protein
MVVPGLGDIKRYRVRYRVCEGGMERMGAVLRPGIGALPITVKGLGGHRCCPGLVIIDSSDDLLKSFTIFLIILSLLLINSIFYNSRERDKIIRLD